MPVTIEIPEAPRTKTYPNPPKVRRQIRKGIAWLDERVPNWELRVVPAKIDLLSDTDCILGQVFGDYRVSGTFGLSTRQFLMYGFVPIRTKLYQDEWREYVSYRRAELLG